MPESTPGHRLYLIRLALGDGKRSAMPLRAFADRVREVTGESYDASALSLMERDRQPMKIQDVEAFAAVDPGQRGKSWLAFGDDPPANPVIAPDPLLDRKLTEEEEERAIRAAEAERAARARGRKRGKDGRRAG